MKKNLLVLFAVLLTLVANAQVKSDQSLIFSAVEQMPTFPGGFENFINYIGQSIHYPINAKPEKIEGTIIINFIIEKDGSLTDVKPLRFSVENKIANEIVRVINDSPNWNPGIQNGKPVRVAFTLPIKFPIQVNLDSIYHSVAKQAEFPGGLTAFYNFIQTNIQYPSESWDGNIQGKVFIKFVVQKDGRVTYSKVIRHVAYDIDNEVLRVINLSPKWTPGEYNGNIVTSEFTIPITFRKPQKTADTNKTVVATPANKNDTTVYSLDYLKSKEIDISGNAPNPIKNQSVSIPYSDGTTKKMQQTVYVSFVVEKDGKLSNIHLIKNVTKNLDRSALEIVTSIPPFKPFAIDGQPIRVNYDLKIEFNMN